MIEHLLEELELRAREAEEAQQCEHEEVHLASETSKRTIAELDGCREYRAT